MVIQSLTNQIINSDEQILSEIGIHISSLKALKIQERSYYIKIIQCLRKTKNITSIDQQIDHYLEAIGYLCIIKKFLPIQQILDHPIPFNNNFPDLQTTLSEYLLIKEFYSKMVYICQSILDAFSNESIDLLEIEFLFANAKAGIIDRSWGCELFQNIYSKTAPNSFLYFQCLVRLAHQQLGIGNYRESMGNLQKALNDLEKEQYNYYEQSRINEIKIGIFAGISKIELSCNNLYEALSFNEKCIQLIKFSGLDYQLIDPLGHTGIIYRKLKRYDLALYYLQEAQKIAVQINDEKKIEWSNHHLAYVFLAQGENELAEELANRCLEKAILEKRDNEIGDFYEQLGLIKLAKNQVDNAIENLELSLSFRKKVGNQHGTSSSCKHLSLAKFIKKDYRDAYKYIRECLALLYFLKILNFRRIYQIIYLFLDWTVGKKIRQNNHDS